MSLHLFDEASHAPGFVGLYRFMSYSAAHFIMGIEVMKWNKSCTHKTPTRALHLHRQKHDSARGPQFAGAVAKPQHPDRAHAEARETRNHADGCTQYATSIRWKCRHSLLASSEARKWHYSVRYSLGFACSFQFLHALNFIVCNTYSSRNIIGY